jgi:hypothetical protein
MTDAPAFLHQIVERLDRAVLEAETTAHLHAEPDARRATRTGYRHGYTPRQLNARVGALTSQLPRDRDGTFSAQLCARHQRSEQALVLATAPTCPEPVLGGPTHCRVHRLASAVLPVRQRCGFCAYPADPAFAVVLEQLNVCVASPGEEFAMLINTQVRIVHRFH